MDGPEEALERQERVNRLGNLTLLTASLNSKVSNGPWASKREAMLTHNTMTMTGRLVGTDDDMKWDEAAIDGRTGQMIDVLLHVWPVPEGHQGQVVDPQTKAGDWVQLKHLVEGGALKIGDTLSATHRDFVGREAAIGEDLRIHLDGKSFDTPSGAAKHLRRRATNGWYFWATADGRRLRDVRQEFLGGSAAGHNPKAAYYREFWELALAEIRERHPTWTRGTTSSGAWIDISVGTPGVVVSTVWTASGLESQLYFNADDAEVNAQRYRQLLSRRERFEAQLDLEPQWDSMEGRKAARVTLVSPFASIDDREQWDGAIDWLIHAQAQLRHAYSSVNGIAD